MQLNTAISTDAIGANSLEEIVALADKCSFFWIWQLLTLHGDGQVSTQLV